MKKLLTLLFILFFAVPTAIGDVASAAEQRMVIIVQSPNAYAYHRTYDCSAVKRATHPVVEVTLEEAVQKGRKPCGICYKQ